MLYYIDLKGLSQFYKIEKEALKMKTFNELEKMEEDMKRKKADILASSNERDAEFGRIIRKFFKPFQFLLQWFTEEDIIRACAANVTERDIISYHNVRSGSGCFYPGSEFEKTGMSYLPRYAKSGEELMQREYTKCDIYRIRNQYQGICHGKVILYLLYQKYPFLQEYNFLAYEYSEYENRPYEIYAKNVYFPFAAIMEKDIAAIIKRNLEYAVSYNHGEYTPEKVAARLESEEVHKLFQIILDM